MAFFNFNKIYSLWGTSWGLNDNFARLSMHLESEYRETTELTKRCTDLAHRCNDLEKRVLELEANDVKYPA